MELAFDILLLVVACLWLGFAGIGFLGYFLMRVLPMDRAEGQPGVTVVIAVRDEATRIAGTVQRLLAQEGIDLQLVVADDGSKDGSREILREIAANDPRLELIEIDELPSDWIGKCYACHVAAAKARHPWILFADADSWMSADLISRAVGSAEKADIDQFCLVPGLAHTTFAGRVMAVSMALGLYLMVVPVMLGKRGAYAGIGSFNLVRREAYEAIDGHEALRMEILEDIRLGELLDNAGYRSNLAYAQQSFQVEWLTDLPSFFRILEKNFFGLIHYRIWALILHQVCIYLCWALAMIGPFFLGLPGLLAGIGLWSCALPAMLTGPRYGWSIFPGMSAPLAMPLIAAGMLHSALSILLQGGVRWRNRFYPLEKLREFGKR